jgi:hypothetical protein
MVLFLDDTSIIITDENKLNFKINLNHICKQINAWFITSLLTLKFKKTPYLVMVQFGFIVPRGYSTSVSSAKVAVVDSGEVGMSAVYSRYNNFFNPSLFTICTGAFSKLVGGSR